ncbi:hypothetical protein ACIPRL_35670 [Streptomyces sp. NPDC090085]|uniref:hypothetical protein n=1 Tax=Streptomyces sp. NPDC090085 TaxID=3365943 RepID=UPI00380DAD2F
MTFLLAAILIAASAAAAIAYTVRMFQYVAAGTATFILAISGKAIAFPKAFDTLRENASAMTVPSGHRAGPVAH